MRFLVCDAGRPRKEKHQSGTNLAYRVRCVRISSRYYAARLHALRNRAEARAAGLSGCL